jgi:hypothetical protein
MIFEPLQAQRHIRVTQQHTRQDFAHFMKWLVVELYPLAEVIRVVLDNLATHRLAALFQVFPPEEARRILKKLEFQPAERSTLAAEAQVLILERNRAEATVYWRFRSVDTRIKLKKLYPSISA